MSTQLVVLAALPPADDRLYGPAPFSVWWLLAGIAALGLAVAAAAVAVRTARRHRAVAPTADDAAARCLAALAELERRWAAGEVGAREVHHALSRTLRTFLADTGTDGAPAMSVDALTAAGHDQVASTVRSFEPCQFERRPDADPVGSLAATREVIAAAAPTGGRQ